MDTQTASVDIGLTGGVVVSISSTNISCNGENDGAATASGSGGVPFANGDYMYLWSNSATTDTTSNLAPGIYTEFMTKLVTDLSVSYAATDKVTLALNVNNLLNVLPEWEFKADSDNAVATANLNDEAYMKNQSNLITFNQRYSQMTYDGYHFSQLGTMLNFSVNIQF
jgi:hypothetical protein